MVISFKDDFVSIQWFVELPVGLDCIQSFLGELFIGEFVVE